MLASLGDSFGNIIPVKLNDVLDLYVVTLVPKHIANALDLPVAPADPCTLEAPSPDAMGNKILPGYERLGFTITDPANMPRIMWLPLSYPVPVGESLWVNEPVLDPIPNDMATSDAFRGWHTGMRYLYAQHGGK